MDDSNKSPQYYGQEEEHVVWLGCPSWKAYILNFFLCLLWPLAPFILLYIYFKRKSYQFKVTSQRIICKYGILSNRTYELDIDDIRSTNITQSLIDRLVGVGSIEFTTAAGPIKEAAIVGICDPEKLKDLIRSLKRKL